MNLLAHALLSPDEPLVRLGNVAADFVTRRQGETLHEDLRRGIALHWRIDTFTDRHPVVQRAISRLTGYQRFANPLVDVFFDHFLVNRWPLGQSVEEFSQNIHADIRNHEVLLPESARLILGQMIEDQWLLSYGDLPGLRLTLGRMEHRLNVRTKRQVDLVGALTIFEREYDALQGDFVEFWPQLVQVVRTE